MIALKNVLVLQDDIRSCSKIQRMTDFVKSGGCFSISSPYNFAPEPIVISRFKQGLEKIPDHVFPDNKELLLLHDGHHRFLSVFLGEREFLHTEEYTIKDFNSIEEYNSINFTSGWVTPLQIATEIRHADISDFKAKVKSLNEFEAIDYIKANRHYYCAPRNEVYTVVELAQIVSQKCFLKTKQPI